MADSSISGDQPQELRARLAEADSLGDAGKEMQAIAIYEELERRSGHPSDIAVLQLKRAISFTNMGRLCTAEELLSSIDPDLLSDEYRLAFRFEAGRVNAAKGEVENAIVILTQALRDANTLNLSDDLRFVSHAMAILLGTLLSESGQPARAIPLLKKIAYRTHGWEKAYRVLGDCYLQLGDYRKSIKQYRRVAELKDGVADLERNMAIRNLGVAFFRAHTYHKASKYLRVAASRFEEFPEIRREIENLLERCSGSK